MGIHAKEILRLRELLDQILSNHTGQELEKIRNDTDRDFILTAREAKEYGLIDALIEKKEEEEEAIKKS